MIWCSVVLVLSYFYAVTVMSCSDTALKDKDTVLVVVSILPTSLLVAS